ncbi:MAG: ATP-binding protein [Desulfocapsaceae bacterium]
MTNSHQHTRLTLDNSLTELDRLTETLEQCNKEWRLSDKLVLQLNLVLEELFTNAVCYGYEDDSKQKIDFVFLLRNDEIQITMCDNGRPFDPTTPEDPALDEPLSDKQIGGLGIFLARQYTDTLDYRREENKNIVTLTKKI